MGLNMDFRELPRHHFKTVLCDPSWQFAVRSKKGEGRSASQHYQTMSLADHAAIPVRDVCDVDCWLFMWAISTKLDSAIWLMREWGFTYSGSAFCWVKKNKSGEGFFTGMGYTTRKCVEMCLLGKRGNPIRLARDVKELIIAPRREHSRKPSEIYSRIERFCPGPRLDMFSRERRPGWTAFGDEADKFQEAAE